MSGHYLGQKYNPETPIEHDAVERARRWDERMTSARHWIKSGGATIVDWSAHRAWDEGRSYRLTEHVRR